MRTLIFETLFESPLRILRGEREVLPDLSGVLLMFILSKIIIRLITFPVSERTSIEATVRGYHGLISAGITF